MPCHLIGDAHDWVNMNFHVFELSVKYFLRERASIFSGERRPCCVWLKEFKIEQILGIEYVGDKRNCNTTLIIFSVLFVWRYNTLDSLAGAA